MSLRFPGSARLQTEGCLGDLDLDILFLLWLSLRSWLLRTSLSACDRERGRGFSIDLYLLPPSQHWHREPFSHTGWLSRGTGAKERENLGKWEITMCEAVEEERWWQKTAAERGRQGSAEQMVAGREKKRPVLLMQKKKNIKREKDEIQKDERWGGAEKELGFGTKMEEGRKLRQEEGEGREKMS